MTGTVIIFGAKGRFGRAAVHAFLDAGWKVKALVRDKSHKVEKGAELIIGDAHDPDGLAAAANGCDVIVNAFNPPYDKWAKELPIQTANVLEAARSSGATIMIPGNVYNFGEGMPIELTETTPMVPTTKKGRLRCEMEDAYEKASAEGVRTIILRGGDFIERKQTGNWFDSQICAKIDKGIIMYPGPLDRLHAWAYLPDMARAMVALAEKREKFIPFKRIGFPGFSCTGSELIGAIESVSGKNLKVKGLPWGLVRILGLVMPQMREVAEMAYQWRIPHGVGASGLKAVLPDFMATPFKVALADAVQRG